MNITTKFSNNDKVWVARKPVFQGTVGQVRVEITDSAGLNDGYVEDKLPSIQFDNYKPQQKREEQYMLVETGIGSGNLYRDYELFSTEEEANLYATKRIK